MPEEITSRAAYNAASDFVDANVARDYGDKVAFIDPERSLTYGELQARTFRFASALRGLGLRPEERLILLGYDTIDYPVVFFGAIRAGIVVVPLNIFLTGSNTPTCSATAARRRSSWRCRSPGPFCRCSSGCRNCAA